MTTPLDQPLDLPCGATLPNRLAKAAMSEGLADAANHSTPRLETLYHRWAGSGAGLLLSGNVQVDRWHLERPKNVVIDDETGRAQLARLALAGTTQGGHFWIQLSHTGRQVSDRINSAPLSPSDIELDVIRDAGFSFARPKPMTVAEIRHAIGQFAFAAAEVKLAGFTGVSIHAAHGYLISQFLSPLANRRTDEWGGSLENRSRFLIEVITAVRRAVGPRFPVGMKLNASDFQKGGFTNAECVELVKMLNGIGLDLLELSGGSLEQPKVVGVALKDEGEDGPRAKTAAREAYFVAFAGAVRAVAAMPVMVTGGFRSVAAMGDALDRGDLDAIGIGRPLIADPNSPRRLLNGDIVDLAAPEEALDLLHILPWNNMQLERLGDGLEPDLALTGEAASAAFAELEDANMAAILGYRAQRQSDGDAA
ncbi:NADH:flavin oxidoreductase/NADH oxidase family protein [Mycolicibacterium sp. P9-64]|uniref:NADH:flavin oxidoreductase/NADH oxidase family protein n=1 Tax=Mycolicibacterium sp. P9-64 TaxID=2024612 RepID=UPI0011ED3AE8|nr:NADH:flavin oxidoreductase/NADH oxidase family protein [Mycolicibacterium sp. P9-64]KAA0087020.1 NADH:flavin oxidoreductase/NADH oxidase family protein [Mycolicibacterium sp. P9-64]